MHSLVSAALSRYAMPTARTDLALMPTFARATPEAIVSAEAALGQPLPPLLSELYEQVANGGFGPGYGLIGLAGGALLDTGQSLVSLYQGFRQPDPEDPEWAWPAHLLPVSHWGCAIYSCVSFKHPHPIVRFDPNGHELGAPWESAFQPEAHSFEAWFQAWLGGSLSFAQKPA
jgi:hypothetical protein